MSQILHHFTHLGHAQAILQSGMILPSESNVGSPLPTWPPYGEHVGPDVVWLLDTDTLEDFPHGLIVGGNTDKTRVRFTVELPMAPKWVTWRWTHEMHPQWRDTFMDAGGGMYAAEHWYVWPLEIPAKRWRSVTDMDTGLPLVNL